MLLDSSNLAKNIYGTVEISNLLSLWLRRPSNAATARRSQVMSRGKREASYGVVVRKAGELNALGIMTFLSMLGDWARKGLRVN